MTLLLENYVMAMKMGAAISFQDLEDIIDDFGNEILEFDSTGAAAVNWFRISNALTGGDVTLSAMGGDANVDITIRPRGTGVVFLENTDAGASGSFLSLYHNSASPAASDIVGHVDFDGNDSGAAFQTYARIESIARDVTAASEDGDLLMSVVNAGSLRRQLWLDSDLNGILVGEGATAHVSSAGAFDLVLSTNSNTASSNIIITDAINGAITLNLNGTAQATILSVDAGALGSILNLTHDSASPANSDIVGRIAFNGRDDALAPEAYGTISVIVTDVTAANPDADIQIARDIAGTLTNVLVLSDTITLTPAAATGNVQIAGGRGLISNVANGVYPIHKTVAQNNIAAGAGGAIAITNYYTTINSDAGGDAFSLANGDIVGQLKKIQFIIDGGGDAVITPTSLAGGTTITMADAGDFCILQWSSTVWVAIELGNDADGVTAPVLA